MFVELLEQNRRWRATAEYHGSRGQLIICLMDDGLIGGGYYWLFVSPQTKCPLSSIDCRPGTTARLIEAGKLRLIKGQWPDEILTLLAQHHADDYVGNLLFG
jgi:hypothetical protein